MSSWAKSSASLDKLFGIQNLASDRTGLGFNSSDSSEGKTSTQSQLVYDKFNKMSFVKANVIHDPYESMTYNDQIPQKLNHKVKAGIGFQKPENSKPSWLKNKLDKDKAKAGRKSFVPNQPWRSSTKVKSGWKMVQPKRDLNGQNMKSTLNRSHHNFAQTLTDSSTGKTVKNTVCYTQNRSMINSMHDKTPYEIWNGKKPDISYFRVFGCRCFIHNNGKKHLTAFEPKSDAGIFLGYSAVSKAYRVFNNRSLTVEESAHVIFDETSFRSHSAASLHDLCSRLESTSLDDSYDDVDPQRQSAEDQPALDTPHNTVQQDLPAVTQPAVAPTDTIQPDGAQSDVEQKDLSIHQSTADASVLESDAQPNNDNHQLADTETVFTSNSDLDRGTEIVGTVADEEQLQVFATQLMKSRCLLMIFYMQISDDMMLPSVTAAEITKIISDLPVKIKEVQEHDWYYANLPKISTTEKGKAPLEEADPVKGNPAREMVELICADVNFLVQMRDQVMHDVVEFCHSFSINKLSDLASLRALAEKEKFMLLWAEADSLETAVRRRVYILAKYREMLLRKFLNSHLYCSPSPQHDSFPSFQEAETERSVHRESYSMPSVLVSDPNAQVDMVQRPDSQIPNFDSPMRFNSDDISLDDTADNQFSLPAVTTELSASLDALRTFLSQRLDTQTKDIRQIDDSQNDVLSKLNTLEKGLRDTLRQLETPTEEGSANREAGIGGDGRNRGGSGYSGSQSRGNKSGSTKKRGSGGESHVRGVRYGPYPPTGIPKRSDKH
ncbi:hypothetical protein F511_18551 [Dorcoceras hygrometricum]|uniref:Retroviral polymerase SH3-like domain-containing protein n=1 Tax=Dorcoceras hygrometricum TaxID=472368 RepID=A0A2Z7AHU5_9LAMI|nr:hypothetical protein F511_18551 [Dorcoceras hygrometricum]